ncbi:MAG TPA: CHAP domain-containing protein [Longimicrobium sp.]|nr:CHAP domain-containing protein [Longimicrobium sp.]
MTTPLRKRGAVLLAVAALAACTDRTSSPFEPGISAPRAYTAPLVPADGELVRLAGTVYLAYGQTLYGIQDMQTLRACSGGHDRAIRDVSSLPAWTMRTLPSAGSPTARPQGRAWMFGDRPVRRSDGTVFLLVGCVKSGIPNPETYSAIFNGDWSRIVDVSDTDLNAFPTGPVAAAVPLRRAGTLVESGGTVRWTRFHGGSFGIETAALMGSYCRGWGEMVSGATEYNAYPQTGLLNPNSGGCTRGDDYPWKTQTGSAPYAYPYRQCTSFAAFRLNQDGIEFHNQYLGQWFSDAHTWDNAALAAGLSVNTTPRKGDIAVWEAGVAGASSFGHVAYVAGVNQDGTILIEDYNWIAGQYRSQSISPAGLKFIHFHP